MRRHVLVFEVGEFSDCSQRPGNLICTFYVLYNIRIRQHDACDDSDNYNHDLGTHFFHEDSLDCT